MISPRIRNVLDVAASLSMIVASGALVWTTFGTTPRDDSASAAAPNDGVIDVTAKALTVPLGDAHGSRPTAARVAVVEFTDFECPFCAKHARETLPEIRSAFVDTGRSAYLVKNLPIESLHPRAIDAAAFATCAGEQDRYWQAHDLLFTQFRALKDGGGSLSAQIKLDQARYDACAQTAPTRVRRVAADAGRLGIAATPTFLLGYLSGNELVVRKRIEGARPYDMFKKALDDLLAQGNGARIAQ